MFGAMPPLQPEKLSLICAAVAPDGPNDVLLSNELYIVPLFGRPFPSKAQTPMMVGPVKVAEAKPRLGAPYMEKVRVNWPKLEVSEAPDTVRQLP